MSEAANAFERSINDVQELLEKFNEGNSHASSKSTDMVIADE